MEYNGERREERENVEMKERERERGGCVKGGKKTGKERVAD